MIPVEDHATMRPVLMCKGCSRPMPHLYQHNELHPAPPAVPLFEKEIYACLVCATLRQWGMIGR